MKNKLAYIILIAFSIVNLCIHAQSQLDYSNDPISLKEDKCDLIIMKNGDEIEAKISEILINEIKYKLCNYTDGPTITILKSEVFMIKFANGTKQVIKSTPQPDKQVNNTYSNNRPNNNISTENINFPRNILSLNPIHFLNGFFSINYETISKNGKVGYRIPISIAYVNNNQALLNISNNRYDLGSFLTGLDIKFYPTGQGPVRGFIGPSLGLTNFIYTNNISGILGPIGGISFNPAKGFNITLDGFLGAGYDFERKGTFYNYRIGLTFGIRF